MKNVPFVSFLSLYFKRLSPYLFQSFSKVFRQKRIQERIDTRTAVGQHVGHDLYRYDEQSRLVVGIKWFEYEDYLNRKPTNCECWHTKMNFNLKLSEFVVIVNDGKINIKYETHPALRPLPFGLLAFCLVWRIFMVDMSMKSRKTFHNWQEIHARNVKMFFHLESNEV